MGPPHAGAVLVGLGQQLHAMAGECGDDLCPKGRPFRDRVRRLFWGCTKTDTWVPDLLEEFARVKSALFCDRTCGLELFPS